jgi:hypothetical protein
MESFFLSHKFCIVAKINTNVKSTCSLETKNIVIVFLIKSNKQWGFQVLKNNFDREDV